ncbi:MAG TPA: DNA ligase D [Thermoanaerobaculia bacterium]|nr:DNA ligase D [Thermoanaerobaculia bacterium]
MVAKSRPPIRTKADHLIRGFFPPMLATLASEPPASDAQWIYELKYDGFRAITALAGGSLAMWSRNQLDLAPRFPSVAKAVAGLKVPDVVLDGEIVAVDEDGVPRFQLLQGGHREKLFLFDVLWLDGRDLRRLPYEERRSILGKLIKRPPAEVALAERFTVGGKEALRRAAAGGYEGVIAKRRGSIYEMRRSREWLKIKALNQQEFIIVGYNPSTASEREIGSLHLAYNAADGTLQYAGKVGTGFSSRLREELRRDLSRDVVPQPMVTGAPRYRDATWVRPRLVGQVAFTEWTSDGKLRHPSFLGLRFDKSPDEVVLEKPAGQSKGGSKRAAAPSGGKKKVPSIAAPKVILSNPDRLLYPRDRITKQQLAEYYEAVADPMLRALRDRPLSLEHWNQGIDKPSWFHQHLGREAPEWLHTIDTPTRASARKSVRHLAVDGVESLRWLAQMSVLTVHMWASHEPTLDQPDWVVFDLDPAKGKGIEQAIEAAIVMRKVLEGLELPSVPKTSGKRGIHVFVPIAKGYSHEEAAEFACNVAAAVTSHVPDMTVERSIAKRRGRLYLDCMQNGYGKTVVAPYSPRAIDGAPVSAPLKWEEITRKLDPLKFNLRTIPNRLAKIGDLFAPALAKGVKLPQLK